MSLNARLGPECLIRCDLNKMLSIKIFFVSKEMQKEKNGREEFKKFNIQAVSEG